MACAASLMREDNFLCSICLNVFTKPASLPCGHNFCLDCITDYWDTIETVVKCPVCSEKFCTKPMLRVNIFIAEMAAKFKKSVQETSSVPPEQAAGSGHVLCDVCTGAKVKAVKSCLLCCMSYCQQHLEPHQKKATLQKHKLIQPVKDLESRICKNHNKPLDLFCRVDKMFLCESCEDDDHKKHIVPLEEEAQIRKAQLGLEKNGRDQMVGMHQQKVLEVQHSREASRNNAEKALSCSKHVMTALVNYIWRSQAEMTEVIEARQEKNEREAEGLIKEMEEEIMQIQQKILQLNEVSLIDDPFIFLENFLSLTIVPPEVKDWSNVTFNSDQFAIEEAMLKLRTTVRKEISLLCDPDFKEKQRHAVDVTLNPDTAHPLLTVSEDGKQVTNGNRKRYVQNKPERFDQVLNVLANEGFSSGKFYYEVQVKDKTEWDLGVANQSINRKGDIRLSPKSGYWTIWLRNRQDFTANAGPAETLHIRDIPQKVGVFVDYEGGQVSFYDVDARAVIYSFTECNFTEKIFPFFSPCGNDRGRNAAPLIITPVEFSS